MVFLLLHHVGAVFPPGHKDAQKNKEETVVVISVFHQGGTDEEEDGHDPQDNPDGTSLLETEKVLRHGLASSQFIKCNAGGHRCIQRITGA